MTLAKRIREAIAALKGTRRRTYPAGQLTRLSNTWTTDPGSLNRTLRYELRILRARSRQICRADGYAAKFIHAAEDNIAGPHPFRLQAKIKRPRGTLDYRANKLLEDSWRKWSRAEFCDVSGRLSLEAMHRLIVRTIARDGEAIIRVHRGPSYGPFGIQLQLLDIDRLDEEVNEDLGSRGAIKVGVEVDNVNRPVAYHVLRTHPGEVGQWNAGGTREHERVMSRDMIHAFLSDAPEAVRGVPWLSPVLMRLWNVGGFEEAAVINARVGATKMGFYVSPDGALPGTLTDGTDASGKFVQDAEAGSFEVLPSGYDFKTWDPQFPDASIEPFIRQTLRGIAAGLGVAYHSLANDPSNVNYSTARVALLEERDMWSSLQAWYVEHVCRPIYDAWREMAVVRGMLPSEATGERWDSVWWQTKTWDWVDPLKDTQAELESLKAGLTSRTRIAAERGRDIEDIFDEIAAENALAAEKGIELESGSEPEAEAAATEEDQEDEAETERRLRVVS